MNERSMTKLKTRLLAVARLGLLAALAGLGVTLVFSAWANRSEAEQISSLLDHGQADRFFRAIPELHEHNRGPATSADLAKLLEQFRVEGLRYLVEYDSHGNVLAEAGEHQGRSRPLPDNISGQPVVSGERVRVTFRPPRPNPRHRGEPQQFPRPPHDSFRPAPPGMADEEPHFRPPGDGHLPDLVFEFEPTVANRLRERAERSFWFSITAAVSLLALTLGLWLALRREERRRVRTERERQLTSLGEMSAVLAHEIRNPLASLKGHAQLLGEQLDAASPLQKKVARIVGEAKRLEELTGTLLDLVRSSSVTKQPTDPARLVREAAESVAPARVSIDASRAPESWQLDGLRMDQVLKNLLQNAAQATPEGGMLEASISVERGQLQIQVRDHGAGLPEGATERLFEPFHTTRTQGTGLGLAVARRIVELHGGTIHAENHAEGGALFTLSIPE